MPLLDVAIDCRASGAKIPDEDNLALWAQAGYLKKAKTSVSISIVDETESQALNLQYRKKHSSTNVLSFPMDLPPEAPESMLGDLVLCATVIEREAQQQGKSSDAHWAHMLVHGMLHLQGYDHAQQDEAIVMEALECEILADFGYADPYCVDL